MTDDLERRKELARTVFDSLAGVPVDALVMVGATLTLAGRVAADDTLEQFGTTLDWYAQDLATTGEVSGLVVLRMARHLRRFDARFVDRLAGVEVPPWPAITRAVKELVRSD